MIFHLVGSQPHPLVGQGVHRPLGLPTVIIGHAHRLGQPGVNRLQHGLHPRFHRHRRQRHVNLIQGHLLHTQPPQTAAQRAQQTGAAQPPRVGHKFGGHRRGLLGLAQKLPQIGFRFALSVHFGRVKQVNPRLHTGFEHRLQVVFLITLPKAPHHTVPPRPGARSNLHPVKDGVLPAAFRFHHPSAALVITPLGYALSESSSPRA